MNKTPQFALRDYVARELGLVVSSYAAVAYFGNGPCSGELSFGDDTAYVRDIRGYRVAEIPYADPEFIDKVKELIHLERTGAWDDECDPVTAPPPTI